MKVLSILRGSDGTCRHGQSSPSSSLYPSDVCQQRGSKKSIQVISPRSVLITVLRLPRTPFTAVLFPNSRNPHCEIQHRKDIHFHGSPLSHSPPTPSICQVASRQVISKNCNLITITVLPTSRYSSISKLRCYIRGLRTL
jgi:hypothetical protein